MRCTQPEPEKPFELQQVAAPKQFDGQAREHIIGERMVPCRKYERVKGQTMACCDSLERETRLQATATKTRGKFCTTTNCFSPYKVSHSCTVAALLYQIQAEQVNETVTYTDLGKRLPKARGSEEKTKI
jgi:hypothetical protein